MLLRLAKISLVYVLVFSAVESQWCFENSSMSGKLPGVWATVLQWFIFVLKE